MSETKKEEHQIKRVTVGSVLGWIFSLIFIVTAFSALIRAEFIQSFILLIMALVLLPSVDRMIREKAHFELSTGVKVLIIIVGFIILSLVIRSEKQNLQISSASSEAQQPVNKDCKESAGGSCLKIIESSYRHNPMGNYDFYDIVGQVQNVGTGKNNYNPWHGIEGSCYSNGKLVDTAGSTFDLLEPGETTTFKVSIDAHGQKVDKCGVKVTY